MRQLFLIISRFIMEIIKNILRILRYFPLLLLNIQSISRSILMDLSKFVNSLKTTTSRKIRKEFIEELPQVYGRRHVFWNESYFIASCGGVTVETLKKYVQSQNSPHN